VHDQSRTAPGKRRLASLIGALALTLATLAGTLGLPSPAAAQPASPAQPAANARWGGRSVAPDVAAVLAAHLPPAAVRKLAGATAVPSAASAALCSSAPSAALNVLVNCDRPDAPHNEPAVAVNPRNPANIVAGANDYQWLNATTRTLLSRAHVSRDAGRSWTDVALPYPAECTFTGDPSLAFDAAGAVYYSTLCEDTGSVLVTASHDGGFTWSPQTVVDSGSATKFDDHPVLAAWGHGNLVITWVLYSYTTSAQDHMISAPTVASVSHDGAQTFGAVHDVSGSLPQCVSSTPQNPCGTWGDAVTVTPDGTILGTFYVTPQYRSDSSTNLARNTHYAMEMDPNTGALVDHPHVIGLAYDGINEHDLPVNVEGRQTLHDSQFRILMQGNIASDPTNANHVAVVWFDDRNAPHPVSADPYAATTNSDIIVSQSFDKGKTWSAPTAIRRAGDQFFPWAVYDPFGRLRVSFSDRSFDPGKANRQYGQTLATEVIPGSLQFTNVRVSTSLSDPTQGNRWSTTTVNPAFPDASRFIGDYNGAAMVGPAVIMVWTDQRVQSCQFGPCGHGEGIFAALVP
jgi:hypothetical protein